MRFDFPSFNESIMEDFVTEGDAIRDSAITTQLTNDMYIENFNWSGLGRIQGSNQTLA
jgi:hypothetical protein